LHNPTDLIDFAVEIDSQALRQMKDSNKLLAPLGLHFEKPPAERFRNIALQRSSIFAARFFHTILLMRLSWLQTTYQTAGKLLHTKGQAEKEVWTDFHQTTESTMISVVNRILALVHVYIYPDLTDSEGPLTSESVQPLIYPLQTFAGYSWMTAKQRECAKEALLQIGTRAKLPIATKIADAFHTSERERGVVAHPT
jgi:hypothetical protein